MKAAISVVALIVLAACGKDSTGGNSGPYRCLGDPLPTSAPANIMVTGVVTHGVIAPGPDSGATVTAYQIGNATPLALTTTAANGTFSVNPATGGVPLDGYLQVSKTGYVTTFAYPPAPLAANAQQSVVIVTATEFNNIAGALGITQDPSKGFIALVVEDCDGTPIAGATVTTNPAGTYRYNAGGFPSNSASSTSADGIAYVFNVTAGNVVVMAQGGGHTLRSHTVAANTTGIVLTAITPGPVQ